MLLYLQSQNEGSLAQLVQSIPITSEGALAKELKLREFSSAGSEHLPYKQRVTGSNPVTPTKPDSNIGLFVYHQKCILFISFIR
jgi:hypothetical protein